MKRLIVALVILIVLAVVASTTSARNAEYYFNKGRQYFASRNYDKAIQYFNRAIELCPRCSGIYCAKAHRQ